MRHVHLRPPWMLVRVAGPSMVPTLKDGDLVLIRRRARIRPNDVVLAEFWELPGRLVIKRAYRQVRDQQRAGWELRSDNEFAGGDSRAHGPAGVHGRAVAAWRVQTPGIPRLLPRRVR